MKRRNFVSTVFASFASLLGIPQKGNPADRTVMYVESGWHIRQVLSRARSLAIHELKCSVRFQFNTYDFVVLPTGEWLTNHPDPTMQPGYRSHV